MIQPEDRLKLFSNELNEISDEKLRNFAEDLIINADDYFFTIAASTTGKYHPQFDLGVGGLVRHTRCVVFFAICEATSRCFEDHEKDLLIVSIRGTLWAAVPIRDASIVRKTCVSVTLP